MPHGLALHQPSPAPWHCKDPCKPGAGQTSAPNTPPQHPPSSRQAPSHQRSAWGACPAHGTVPSSLPHPGGPSGVLGVPHPKPRGARPTGALPPSPQRLLLAWVSQPLLPELALAAPACSKATNVALLVSIPVPVFLLLQPLEQQLVREAPQ